MRSRRPYRLTDVLFDAVRQLLPPERRNWAQAMRAEADYVSQDERLRWALGCVWTAIKQRFAPMHTGDYRVSRWVMLVEAIGSFGPLTLGWFEIVFGRSGVVRLTGEIVDKNFMTYPGGRFILVMMFVNSVTGLLGPVGLLIGLRYVLTGRGIESRMLGWTMAAVPVVVNLIGTIAGRFWGPPDFQVPLTFIFLFAWLPAAVILHLMWLARPVQISPPVAAAE
jgi:hypothetical protein